MLSLGKEVDYALICLGHLAAQPNRVWSARQIAEQHGLPLPLLMNLLKRLHRSGVVRSTRGTRGGYQLGIDLDEVCLYDLMQVVGRSGTDAKGQKSDGRDRLPVRRALHVPMQALQYRLVRFLKEVKLSDLVVPGRRIDVPREVLAEECTCVLSRKLKAEAPVVLELTTTP